MAERENNPMEPTEPAIQAQLVQYIEFKYKGVLYNHSPNEGKRTVINGHILKTMGMHKGFPDLFFYEPRFGYHGLAIELKRNKKSHVSPEQRKWIQDLEDRGYAAFVCYGFDGAADIIDRYMEGRLQNG